MDVPTKRPLSRAITQFVDKGGLDLRQSYTNMHINYSSFSNLGYSFAFGFLPILA